MVATIGMLVDLHYAYLVGDLMLGVGWLALFLWRRDLVREMVVVGLIMGTTALAVAPLFYDYWRPLYLHPFGLEEFFYGFFAGGIASVLYEELYGKHFTNRRDRRHHWVLIFFSLGLLSALAFFYMLSIGILSIYASAFLLILCGTLPLALRHDLVADALVSGFAFAFFSAVFSVAYLYIFPTVVETWWNVELLTGTDMLGFPAEEIMWAFAFGFSAGPLYEFLAGRKFAR